MDLSQNLEPQNVFGELPKMIQFYKHVSMHGDDTMNTSGKQL